MKSSSSTIKTKKAGLVRACKSAAIEALETRNLFAGIAIASGQTIAGAISSPSEQDQYTFTATKGDSVRVAMGEATDTDLDPRLDLFAPDGTRVDYGSSTYNGPGVAIQGINLPLTGTYVIVASDEGSNDTGSYSITLSGTIHPVTPGDADDQISEAISLALNGSVTNLIDISTDVDMYKISLSQGQYVGFDLDPTATAGTLPLLSYLRIFSYDPITKLSVELKNAGLSAAPGETQPSKVGGQPSAYSGSYIEFNCPKTGTYYVGVSGATHKNYNAVTGSDGTPTTLTGGYTLGTTLLFNGITRSTSGNSLFGTVQIGDWGTTRKSQINVSLIRKSGLAQAGTIDPSKNTWVVIHGRNGLTSDFATLCSGLDGYEKTDQVLALDWSAGAADNSPSLSGLQGASWITSVGLWVSQALISLKLIGANVRLVGHSWGTYVAYETARRISGGVNSIVALDPAYDGYGYLVDSINFASVSKWSWAFYGSGTFGSATLSGRADEAFDTYYDGIIPVGPLDAHSTPVRIFEYILGENNKATPSDRARLFNLNNLINAKPGPWLLNKYKSSGLGELDKLVFEGRFTVPVSFSKPGIVSKFQYFVLNGLERVLV